jgi:hypothetical protein
VFDSCGNYAQTNPAAAAEVKEFSVPVFRRNSLVFISFYLNFTENKVP